jgi:hypothetical protein
MQLNLESKGSAEIEQGFDGPNGVVNMKRMAIRRAAMKTGAARSIPTRRAAMKTRTAKSISALMRMVLGVAAATMTPTRMMDKGKGKLREEFQKREKH